MSGLNFFEPKMKKTMIQNQNLMPGEYRKGLLDVPRAEARPRGDTFSPQFTKMDVMNRKIVAPRHGDSRSISQAKRPSPAECWNSVDEFKGNGPRAFKGRSSVRVEVGGRVSRVQYKSKFENDSRMGYTVGQFETTPRGQRTMGVEFVGRRDGGQLLAGFVSGFGRHIDRVSGKRSAFEYHHFRSPLLRKRSSMFNRPGQMPKLDYPTVKKISSRYKSGPVRPFKSRNEAILKTATQQRSCKLSEFSRGRTQYFENKKIETLQSMCGGRVVNGVQTQSRSGGHNVVYTNNILTGIPRKEFFEPKMCESKVKVGMSGVSSLEVAESDRILKEFKKEALTFPKRVVEKRNGFSSLVNPRVRRVLGSSPLDLFQKDEKTDVKDLKNIDELKNIGDKRDLKNEVESLQLKNGQGEYFLVNLPEFIGGQEFQNCDDEVLVLAIKKSREELEGDEMYDHLKEDKPIRIEARKSKRRRLVDQFNQYIAILAQESVDYRTRHPSLERMVFYTKNEMFKIKPGVFIGRVKSIELKKENFVQCDELLSEVLCTFEDEDLAELESESESSLSDLNGNRNDESEKEEKIGQFKIQKSSLGDEEFANLVEPKNDETSQNKAPKSQISDHSPNLSSLALKALVHELLFNKILTATSSIDFTALRRLALNNRLSQPLSLAFFIITLSQFLDSPIFDLAYKLVLRIFEKSFGGVVASGRVVFIEGEVQLKWGAGDLSEGKLDQIKFQEIVSETMGEMLKELGEGGEESRFEFMNMVKNIGFAKLIEDFVFLFEEITSA